jgi:hypothetical protein
MLQPRSDSKPGQLESNWRSGPFLILALAAFIVLAGIGTLIYNDRLYESMRRAETKSQAEVLAASVTAALDFDDAYAANEAVSAFRVNRQVRWVGAFNENGNRIAGYARSGAELPAGTADMPPEGSGIRVTVPVISAGQKVGEVGLEVDSEHLIRRISRYFLLGALIVLAGLVLAVLGLSQASLRRANRQLEDRAEALAAANILLAEQMEVRQAPKSSSPQPEDAGARTADRRDRTRLQQSADGDPGIG